MISTSAANDDAVSAEGKVTDKGKTKGLTGSDVTPRISNVNGANIVVDNSNIPRSYKVDPTEGLFTFGILSLGPVNGADITRLIIQTTKQLYLLHDDSSSLYL